MDHNVHALNDYLSISTIYKPFFAVIFAGENKGGKTINWGVILQDIL